MQTDPIGGCTTKEEQKAKGTDTALWDSLGTFVLFLQFFLIYYIINVD